MAGSLLSESTLAERDMALVLREVELNRREDALRRDEEARANYEGSRARGPSTLEEALEARLAEVDRREREMQMALEAVGAQRERLEEVRGEYELRRDALAARTREVERERNRLRDEQAQLVCASLELEEAEQSVAVTVRSAAPASVRAVEHEPEPVAAPVQENPVPENQERSDVDWWSRQLGSPLEAA